MIRDVYGGKPYYLAAYDDGRLIGVLPLMLRRVIGAGRVLTSVPFADVGGICAHGPEAEQVLLEAAAGLGREKRVSYVELRQLDHALPGDLPCDLSRVVLRLNLPSSLDELREGLSRNMRKKLKRAERDGLTSREYASLGPAPEAQVNAVGAFYDVYARNMRDLGSPMHSLRYFRAIAVAFPEASLCLHVSLEGKVVGAAFAVWSGATLTVLCAHSLRRYQQVFPNNLLYWRLFGAAIDRQCSVADFGRSPRGTGIYEFKKLWGMVDCPLCCAYIPLTKVPRLGERREGAAYRLFSRLWPHVPMPVARALGPKLFARLPV